MSFLTKMNISSTWIPNEDSDMYDQGQGQARGFNTLSSPDNWDTRDGHDGNFGSSSSSSVDLANQKPKFIMADGNGGFNNNNDRASWSTSTPYGKTGKTRFKAPLRNSEDDLSDDAGHGRFNGSGTKATDWSPIKGPRAKMSYKEEYGFDPEEENEKYRTLGPQYVPPGCCGSQIMNMEMTEEEAARWRDLAEMLSKTQYRKD